jgi:16S rRNA (uracil1498-N3)-methyltransferase
MTSPLFVADTTIVPVGITEGQRIALPDSLVRHIVKSLRMQQGDELMVTDGAGTRVTGTLLDAENGIVESTLVEHEEEPRVKLCLVQALAKGGRDEMAIEESTEIGVDMVVPWQADRSIVQWNGAKQAKAARKWESVLTAASEQSRRSRVPQLCKKVSTRQLGVLIEEATARGDLVVVLHQDATQTWGQIEETCDALAHQMKENPGRHPAIVYFIVGPEGGISDQEVTQFTQAGAQAVVIGHNILRASTAGPVAVALLSRALGRF